MLTRADCAALDEADPLSSFRSRFALPDGLIYLDGNSLGVQGSHLPMAADDVLDEWRRHLIGGWRDAGWWELPLALGDRIGHLIGAAPGLVIVCDTTTSNLYKVLHAAMGLRADRDVALVEESSFPTDRYVVGAVAQQRDATVRVVPRDTDPVECLDDSVAVAVLNHVDFRTSRLLDLPAATAAVHDVGALVVWDLSHSAGVIPMNLDAAGVDFAVGCTYKYLNGGPGSPAYLYAAARHLEVATQPIRGWLGHADPFAMTSDYEPAPGVRRFLTGTQPIVSMRMIEAALDIYEDVSIDRLRAKSISLTDLFVRLVDDRLGGSGIELVSPRDRHRRGSQVSLTHPDAIDVYDRLVEAGVRGDFRTPNILRFGFAPLYTSHVDVWDAVETIRAVVDARPAGGQRPLLS